MFIQWHLYLLQAAALLHIAACGGGAGEKEFNFFDLFGGGGETKSSTGGVGKGTSTKNPTSRRWGHPSPTKPPISTKIEIPIEFKNGDWYLMLKVGSRRQELSTILDTGSHHLWVIAEGTTKEGSTAFKSSQSSSHTTQRETCENLFGSGKIEGFWGYDTIELGEGFNSIKVENQAMGEANVIDADMFKDYDAILGLGIMSERAIQGDPEPFLVRLGQIYGKVPSFGIHLNKFNPQGSKLLIGGQGEEAYVTERFTSHTVLPDKDGDYIGWTINIDKVNIKGGPSITTPDGVEATLDSGATFIMLPESIANPINEAIFKNKPSFVKPDADYRIECSKLSMQQIIEMYEKLPEISIVLSGTEYVLTPYDYLLQTPKTCASAFLPFSQILLGRPFLTKYYARFDYENKKVDLARAKQDKPDDYQVSLMKKAVAMKGHQEFAMI